MFNPLYICKKTTTRSKIFCNKFIQLILYSICNINSAIIPTFSIHFIPPLRTTPQLQISQEAHQVLLPAPSKHRSSRIRKEDSQLTLFCPKIFTKRAFTKYGRNLYIILHSYKTMLRFASFTYHFCKACTFP